MTSLSHTVALLTFPPGTDEGRLMPVALEAGAEDVVLAADASIEVLADPVEFVMCQRRSRNTTCVRSTPALM